jgi:hypothetical protein
MKENKRKRVELPTMEDRPRPASEGGPFVGIEGYTVAEWHPTPDGSGPPTALCIILDLGSVQAVWRFKSSNAVDTLIAALERHRDNVWPD